MKGKTKAFRTGHRILGRCLVASALLLAEVPAVSAHPFAFDTAKMLGFKVVTAEDGAMDANDMMVIEYNGLIVFPMAENLREIWTEIRKSNRFQRVVLRLNSPGGTDADGLEVIGVLREMRAQIRLITLVNEHDLCASMCVPVYLRGETRYAGPATSWMFHGAAKALSNIPNLATTQRYFDLFKERRRKLHRFPIRPRLCDVARHLLDLRLRIGREIKHHHQAPAELAASGS
jgi:hypothetical protein